jgi:hypothetical protein
MEDGMRNFCSGPAVIQAPSFLTISQRIYDGFLVRPSGKNIYSIDKSKCYKVDAARIAG